MPSPFPGMDPYLEHPEQWPDVHLGLIVAVRDAIAPRVRPKYRVVIEKRTIAPIRAKPNSPVVPMCGSTRARRRVRCYRVAYADPRNIADRG